MVGIYGRITHRLNWFFFRLFRWIKSLILVNWHRIFPLAFPKNSDGKVRIHLGCGDLNIPGFINIDARPAPHVHVAGDVTDLSLFADGVADLIYASHVLEHIPGVRVNATLWEWRRVLKPGGVLRISVPDFRKILELYQLSDHDAQVIQAPLFGQQDYRENVHLAAYDDAWLRKLLKEAGFNEVRPWHPGTTSGPPIHDCASLEIPCGGDKVFISLNLEAVR